MSNIMSFFFFLLISISATAQTLYFSTLDANEITSIKDITSSEEILSVEAQDANVVIKTNKSTLKVPLLNKHDAQAAIDDIRISHIVFCKFSDEVKSCEALQARFKFHVERTKLFPSYYAAIESSCRSEKSKEMLYGKIGYSGGYKINPLLALSTGESAISRGVLGLVAYKEGKLVKSYKVDEDEIAFLNNTNPLNLNAWLKIDEIRKKVVLLDGQSCKVVGEVPYR